MPETTLLGEVVLATTTQFTAQCLATPRSERIAPLPDPPPFGALVKIALTAATPEEDDESDPFEMPAPRRESPSALYALVFHAETGALEPGRPLTALGLTEGELLKQHPQLYELLTTRFSASLIGWSDAQGTFHGGLPPRPPRAHARVRACSSAEIRAATERLEWLRGLLLGERVPGGLSDELMIAFLKSAWRAHRETGTGEAFIERAARTLAGLLSGDYERLRALLSRLVDDSGD